MRNTITVMNAKGGVGKSTLVLALAETLANDHGRKILVIDADAQASISHMLMRQEELESVQSRGRTFVDYPHHGDAEGEPRSGRTSWSAASPMWTMRARSICCRATRISPCSSGRSPGASTRVAAPDRGRAARRGARLLYDLVLIDSAPGLSVLTESWLREADFYVSPTRPDYISTRGLKFLREFRERDAHMGFAECLGVVINMKESAFARGCRI